MGAATLPTLRTKKSVSAARLQWPKENRRPAKNTAVNEEEHPIALLSRGDSFVVEAQFIDSWICVNGVKVLPRLSVNSYYYNG